MLTSINGIAGVLDDRSEVEVPGIHARRVVALVQYPHAVRDGSVGQRPRVPVGQMSAPDTVSALKSGTSPPPAAVLMRLLNGSPEIALEPWSSGAQFGRRMVKPIPIVPRTHTARDLPTRRTSVDRASHMSIVSPTYDKRPQERHQIVAHADSPNQDPTTWQIHWPAVTSWLRNCTARPQTGHTSVR
jgi:hypothetical protein